METKSINSKHKNAPRKMMGQFKTLDEAVNYKTDLVNQLLKKVEEQQLSLLSR